MVLVRGLAGKGDWLTAFGPCVLIVENVADLRKEGRRRKEKHTRTIRARIS